jgi:DNA-binding NarL/FixJ family response regulator
MNLGADDYLTKPASADEVLSAIKARLDRHGEKEQAAMAKVELKPDFDSAVPLQALGITSREADVLLWVAQGKANADIATILGCAENTVKVHLARVFEKCGFENRHAATVRALEVLSVPRSRS